VLGSQREIIELAEPDYQRSLRVLRDSWRRHWTSEAQMVNVGQLLFNLPLTVIFADILARKSNLCRCRGPPLGEHLPRFFRGRIINSDVCQAAKDVDASQDTLGDLFENFIKRLESYAEVPPIDAMIDVIVKMMVKVLNVFAIATKEMKQGRAGALLPGIT
jgi:hypothetical protein